MRIKVCNRHDGQGGRASPTKGLDRKKSKGPPPGKSQIQISYLDLELKKAQRCGIHPKLG